MAEMGRAAVFRGVKEPFELAEYPVPDPGPRDLVVKIERTKPRFAVPSEDFFKQVLEVLFARRGECVQQILTGSRDRHLPTAALGRLGKKLKNKPVYRLTPREFGEITRVMWEATGRGEKR